MLNSICIFGDSVAKGVVLNSDAGRYALLKDSFANRIAAEKKIAIRNFSRFGSTVSKGLEMLERHRSELKDYDHVVLEFGGNDCDYKWPEIAADPDAEHQPNTPPDAFTEQYAKMICEVRNAGSQPVLLSLPPIDAPRYFAWFSRGINQKNILSWLHNDVEHIYRWHEMYNLEIAHLAGRMNVPLIDITSPFLKRRDYQSMICSDGIHPNEHGHELISHIISGEISRYRKAYAS
ncbi:MAG TPA: hypothetical protein DDW86_01150 [Clostridiales bacterium]|jgi:lysophospholipase L1-like esterase|nr:hypothetical protein [Clostridiales bacterium]